MICCKWILIAALLLLPSGCGQEAPTVDKTLVVNASFEQGRAVFSPEGVSNCALRFRVTAETGETLWHIERTWAHPVAGNPPRCRDIFPLHYGMAPPGFRNVVAPVPLQSGWYHILGEDLDSTYSGRFQAP